MKKFVNSIWVKINSIPNFKYYLFLFIWIICILFALLPRGKRNVKNLSIDDLEYTGEIKGKAIEGEGKIVFPDGEIYEGNFKDNKFEGEGIFLNSQNQKIEGNFEIGKAGTNSIVEIEPGKSWQLGPDNTWINKSSSIVENKNLEETDPDSSDPSQNISEESDSDEMSDSSENETEGAE